VSCPRGRLLSIGHSGRGIIIFVENGSRTLGNAQVPQNTSHTQCHLTHVRRLHVFTFRR
jgi:hypothetical protein